MYDLLSKQYYSPDYEAVYHSRFENICAIHLPVEIHKWPAFYVNLPSFSAKLETIYRLSKATELLWDQLPSKAQERYFTKAMFHELQHTNEIEGIHSSRQELQTAFDSIKSKKNVRFEGLVRSYNWLFQKQKITLQSSQDIRNIYDNTLLPDIDKANAPDGKIFRKGYVGISNGMQDIHKGILPEADLIEFIDSALQHLIQSNFSLLEIAAFHYLFGYAHPFYDGNGRTMRFLSSLFLGAHLNQLIGLNLSAAIFSDKNAYYKAFEICNDQKNRGDLTHFIFYFLNIIERSAKEVFEMLQAAVKRLTYFENLLDQQNLPELEDEIAHLLIQVSLFSDNGITIGGIQRHIKKSYYPAKNALEKLISQFSITSKKQGKEILYRLDLDAFEQAIKNP